MSVKTCMFKGFAMHNMLMQRILRHEAHAQKKTLPSGNPISEGIMTALKPACGAITAAFFFCANPVQQVASNMEIDAAKPALPVIYGLKSNVTGRTVKVDVMQLDMADTTKTFYYCASYGDGAADSGMFHVDSNVIGSLTHSYAASGKYAIKTSLCQNRTFYGATLSVDSVTIE